MGAITTAEVFWSKVDKSGGPDACWPWTKAIARGGYGVTWVNSKWTTSHRASWFFSHGEIPKGLYVCHKCDNPPCCNPAHLFLGDPKANSQDAVSKGRQSHGEKHSLALLPGRKRGENHYAHKLTENQVREIIELRKTGMSRKEIAKRFETPGSTIQKILYRQTWKHLAIEAPKVDRPSKLTKEQVLEIRRMRSENKVPIKELAAHFGVSVFTVNDVIYGRTWTHV